MTYISAQPVLTNDWDDICYPVNPVWLTDLLPDYDIIATDRQQLIVGEPLRGRKTIFGIQSADYTIIPNIWIREVIDKVFGKNYTVQIKYTNTGEFSISIILSDGVSVGGESLQRSMILTNSYNGKTPLTIQGQTFTTMAGEGNKPGTSMYREICQNGLMGWADSFGKLPEYQQWLEEKPKIKDKKQPVKSTQELRKIHHSRLTPALFQSQLYEMLAGQKKARPTLTATVYEHLQQRTLTKSDEGMLRKLPIPVQLAKQAQERLRLEERILGASPSYWLMYNAVNHALFNARSSLTLNDRYKLDERVFHQLAASSFA